MRKIVAAAFVSLDGVMQAPGGPEEDPTGGFRFGGWGAPHFDDRMGEIVGEMFARPFDLLLGRKTYDIFAAHWPYVDKDDPIGPLFDRITKFVATRNPDFRPGWQNTRTLGPDPVATKTLKQEDGPDLLTQGSTDFLKTLLAHGLVDEFNVSVFPVILGKGKRLFGDGARPEGLKLVSVQSSPSGIVVTRYAPDGEVQEPELGFVLAVLRHAQPVGLLVASRAGAAGMPGLVLGVLKRLALPAVVLVALAQFLLQLARSAFASGRGRLAAAHRILLRIWRCLSATSRGAERSRGCVGKPFGRSVFGVTRRETFAYKAPLA